ncbi:selenoprotein H [Silurus meridionalis]|nr:selenoprotein H [Silurus meridionalis]
MAARAKAGRGAKRKADKVAEAEPVEKQEKGNEVEQEEVVLWTGIKKGPPRKLKFPDPAEVVTALEDALKNK